MAKMKMFGFPLLVFKSIGRFVAEMKMFGFPLLVFKSIGRYLSEMKMFGFPFFFKKKRALDLVFAEMIFPRWFLRALDFFGRNEDVWFPCLVSRESLSLLDVFFICFPGLEQKEVVETLLLHGFSSLNRTLNDGFACDFEPNEEGPKKQQRPHAS